ncbi:hypothetical protein N9955_00810 [bacterium]|nr:hypothetical protein [bacterium]
MARTRIISQSKALFVSPTGLLATNYGYPADSGALSPQQLHRIDTFSFDVDIAGSRQDIREFGQLARLDSIRVGEITPTLSFGYWLGDGANEHNLGLNTQGINGLGPLSQMVSGILSEDVNKKEKNIYLLTVSEGVDAFDPTAYSTSARNDHDVVGFGNASVTSYSINLAVGEIPRADVEMECGNIRFYNNASSGSAMINPSLIRETAETLDTGQFVIPQPSTGVTSVDVLRHGDITVNFSNNSVGIGGVDLSGVHLQTASIEVPLSRTAIERIGSQLPYARPLDFPINTTLTLNGFVNEFTDGGLQSILTGCSDQTDTDITITIKDRCQEGDKLKYVFKKAVLDSQNFSIGLDDNETVDLTFSAQIGGATSTDAGVFMSGYFDGIAVTGRDNEYPAYYVAG